MSRIGKQPVTIPQNVTVAIEGSKVKIEGPKGVQFVTLLDTVKVKQEDETLVVSRIDDEKKSKSEHGLIRSLLQNAVTGVDKGFSKKLEVNGVGFKVNLAGKKLTLNLGFSHPIEYMIPEETSAEVVDNTNIVISGADKQQVGQVAAEIRAFKKPEPYKGKGIKYEDEYIIRKAGKAAGAE